MAVSYEDYQQAQRDVMLYQQRVTGYQTKVLELQGDYDTYKAALAAGVPNADPAVLPRIEKKLAQANEDLNAANTELAAANAKIAEFNGQATVPSATDQASVEKMSKAEIVGDTTPEQYNQWAATTGAIPAPTGEVGKDLGNLVDYAAGKVRNFAQDVLGIPKGAVPDKKIAATVNIKDTKGNTKKKDMRVKIRVPDDYLRMTTRGLKGELTNLGGIIFPYTPTISMEHKADYAPTNPMHSNFAIYFYQRSSVTPITISGKFTVQNDQDAGVYLATVHLLRALTKMRFGGENGDPDSGAPPPVCRLDAYGDFMFTNVPVAISSFRIELPDSVDYYTLGKSSNTVYGQASVPVVSTIAITCNPMYSRNEMQKFSVNGWLSDSKIKKAGYL